MKPSVVEHTKTSVGVLDKAVAILLSFPSGDIALHPKEIADRTGFSLPTVYRFQRALCEHGLLEKEGTHYRLGSTLMHLGARVSEGIELRREILSYLKWLNEQTGENAELHVRRGEARISIELVRSLHNLRPFVEIGEPLPLHRGASGKALLAWLSEEKGEVLAAASAEKFGDSEFDAGALHVQLREARAKGWAATDGERSPGVSAIASPIFDVSGEVAGSLVLSAPSVRLGKKQREAFAPLVREAAACASKDLGYAGSFPPSSEETA